MNLSIYHRINKKVLLAVALFALIQVALFLIYEFVEHAGNPEIFKDELGEILFLMLINVFKRHTNLTC